MVSWIVVIEARHVLLEQAHLPLTPLLLVLLLKRYCPTIINGLPNRDVENTGSSSVIGILISLKFKVNRTKAELLLYYRKQCHSQAFLV